jgi:hypothetical protein
MYDRVTDATVQTHQVRYRRVKLRDERAPLGQGERKPEASERVQAIVADALDDSGEPTQIIRFVVGTFQLTAIEGNDIVVK